MRGDGKYAWVTTAVDEDSAIQAVILGKSLSRVITNADTIVLVSDDLAVKFLNLLANYFDSVIHVSSKEIQGTEGVFVLDIIKTFAHNMDTYRKITVLSCNHLILQNCDDLFKMEKDFYLPDVSSRKDSKLQFIFVIKPNSECHDKIVELKRSQQFRPACDIFNDSCGVFSKDAVGRLPEEYNLHTDECKNNATLRWKNFKVISHGFLSKIVSNDNPSIQEIVDFWNMCLAEIKEYLQNEPSDARMKTKTNSNENYYKNSIAIVGQSCRLPEVNNIAEFWDLLISGKEGVTWTPMERLDLSQSENKTSSICNGGFLKCPIEEFDSNFFSISAKEAEMIDPQQRLVLEVAWEALENAAIDPYSLQGGNTGVFTGVWQSDYEKLVRENIENDFSASFASVSNILGLSGPNIAPKSGCSMVALHLACESLKRKETDLGLVMGMNIIEIMYDSPEILDKDGQRKIFDVKKGFRAEGIVVMVLKRLSDAVANGDHVMGIIRGSAMNSTSPDLENENSQKLVMQDALKNSGVRPEEVAYIEMHGTGTSIGDPEEFASISAAYAAKRNDQLVIGSVKVSIGHTESAAGLAGVSKTILSMKNENIPRHRNKVSPDVQTHMEALNAIVLTQNKSWAKITGRIRIAGVNSFGPGGTNVHVLIEEPPKENKFARIKINFLELDRTHHILNLSAKSEKALDDLINSYAQYLENNPTNGIENLTFTANNGRAHFNCRASVVGQNILDLSKALKNKNLNLPVLKETPKICFIFTGHGCQYMGMGNCLYKSNSIFRDAFNECSKFVKKRMGLRLTDVLWRKDGKFLEDFAPCQLSIFSVQYSLMSLLFSLGIKPDFVLGQNVGEYVAAVASGIIDLETALNLLINQSEILAPEVDFYSSMNRLSKLISNFIDENPKGMLHVGKMNSPEDLLVIGRKKSVEKFTDNKSNASKTHGEKSQNVGTIADSLAKNTKEINFGNPVCNYISGTTGLLLTKGEMQNGKYWLGHEMEPENFKKGVTTLTENNCNIFIEIGPRSMLLALGMENVNSVENTLWLPTLEEKEDNWKILLNSLAKLYVNGIDINWSVIDRERNRKKLELPTYPFQREKYWVNLPKISKDEEIQIPIPEEEASVDTST